MRKTVLTLSLLASLFSLQAQSKNKPAAKTSNETATLKTAAMQDIQAGYETYKKIALQLWDYAELGYKEVKKFCTAPGNINGERLCCKSRCCGYPHCFCGFLRKW